VTSPSCGGAGNSYTSLNPGILALTRDLCRFTSGVVAVENEMFFGRLGEELPLTVHRYPSGTSFNGWVVPPLWQVEHATIRKDGRVIFDGTVHPLAVASYSRSFQGEIDFEELKPHLVTKRELPEAYVYHCIWQCRPWDADWAFCIPYETYRTLGPGRYYIDLVTTLRPGEMLVAEGVHRGRSGQTVIFNAHTCHAGQANDDVAGVAVLVRVFQWLRGRDTYYTYKVVLGPEHLGTVFYLRDCTPDELARMVCGAFAEMPGTPGAPLKLASSFLGGQAIDQAFHNVARHHTHAYSCVPWRQGAGNDETVWEAPGYEVPFVEVSRCRDLLAPYPEYHTSLDTPELMDECQVLEFLRVFQGVVDILERNAVLHRRFNGLICLSNPEYRLYLERPDPAVAKDLAADSEKWGHLLDCLFRYLDGSWTVLDIAEKHDLPFDSLYAYLKRFEAKGLVRFEFAPVARVPISSAAC
jgi:aminopeptidase-like protein